MKPQLLNVKTQHRQQNTYPTTAITARPPLTPLTPSCSLILQSEVDNIDSRLAAKEVSDKIRNRTRSAIERVLLRVAEEHTPAGSATHPLSSLSFLGRAPVSLAARLPPGATLLSRPRACLACLAPASRCAPPRLPLPGAGETSSFSPTACAVAECNLSNPEPHLRSVPHWEGAASGVTRRKEGRLAPSSTRPCRS